MNHWATEYLKTAGVGRGALYGALGTLGGAALGGLAGGAAGHHYMDHTDPSFSTTPMDIDLGVGKVHMPAIQYPEQQHFEGLQLGAGVGAGLGGLAGGIGGAEMGLGMGNRPKDNNIVYG